MRSAGILPNTWLYNAQIQVSLRVRPNLIAESLASAGVAPPRCVAGWCMMVCDVGRQTPYPWASRPIYDMLQAEDVQHAMMLVDSMPAESLRPDEATWSLLLEAAHLLHHDELRAAVSLPSPTAVPCSLCGTCICEATRYLRSLSAASEC